VIRADKQLVIERMSESFRGSPHVILATFRGLTVSKESDLRGRIAAVGGQYRVIKNRLARRAAAGTHVELLARSFVGSCAVALHPSDPVALAKVLTGFAKEHPQIELLAGVIDAAQPLAAAEVTRLAELPGLPELRAQLLALIQTPATMLVRLIGTPASQLARVVDARREALGGSAEE